MISISSLMGSGSSSSIYGSRNSNIISGLASGLDTESMIEGLVQSYQQKISGLQQDRTKLEWQQEAYQSVSDKLVEFYRSYMSYAYSSTTNLSSSSFFSNAVQTTAAGEFASLVTASGKSSSEIVLNAVAQLAQAARYTASLGDTKLDTGVTTLQNGRLQASGGAISGTTHTSNLAGTISLSYGSKEISIDLGELELYGKNEDGTGALDDEKLRAAIEEKLSNQTLTIGQTTYTADKVIQVEVKNGQVSFSDQLNAGNKVEIDSLSGALKENASLGESTFRLNDLTAAASHDTAEYLQGKTIEVTLDGHTKTVTLGGSLDSGTELTEANFLETLQKDLDNAFGKGKIQVGSTADSGVYGGELTFSVAQGSTLSITSKAGAALGLEDTGLTTYLNTGRTLGDLLGDNLTNLTAAKGVGKATAEKDGNFYDEAGNLVDKDGFLVNADGEKLYTLTINGTEVGRYSADTALETVMNGINNSDAGVKVQYSQITNQFVFTATETGEGSRVEILKDDQGKDTLGTLLFGAVDPDHLDAAGDSYQQGQDAIFQVKVNGTTMNLSRSSNSVNLDGMTLNLKGTFNAADSVHDGPISSADVDGTLFAQDAEGVTFTTATNADTVVDTVKQMVEDYNEILKTVRDLYNTRPSTTSTGDTYEPLTDEDKEGMTESEIERYEEKAKSGILYMDRDLSSLYNSLRSVLTSNSGLLKSVGLSTSYSDGATTLTLDEQALRQALESDPDAVERAFTQSKANGASSDGLMAAMNRVIDTYASTSGATKGILIEKAGSKYSPTAALDNSILDQMNEVDEKIEKWQDKLSDRVDYYTNQFTQLEVLINQMNSQSSALAGLMGGY